MPNDLQSSDLLVPQVPQKQIKKENGFENLNYWPNLTQGMPMSNRYLFASTISINSIKNINENYKNLEINKQVSDSQSESTITEEKINFEETSLYTSQQISEENSSKKFKHFQDNCEYEKQNKESQNKNINFNQKSLLKSSIQVLQKNEQPSKIYFKNFRSQCKIVLK